MFLTSRNRQLGRDIILPLNVAAGSPLSVSHQLEVFPPGESMKYSLFLCKYFYLPPFGHLCGVGCIVNSWPVFHLLCAEDSSCGRRAEETLRGAIESLILGREPALVVTALVSFGGPQDG